MCLQVLVTEVEQEEEYLVNNLQKRMDKLHLEKQELEKTLEQQRRKVSTQLSTSSSRTWALQRFAARLMR